MAMSIPKFIYLPAVQRLFELRYGPDPISWRTFAVGITLATYMNTKDSNAYPSRAAIAARLNLDAREVSRELVKLEKRGVIAIDRTPGKINRYRLTGGEIPPGDETTRGENTPGGVVILTPDPGELDHPERKSIEKSEEELLSRYSQEQCELIQQAFDALASTRKGGKVSDSVLAAQLVNWSRYPVERVIAGIQVYLDKDCSRSGKAEAYLLGIIRNQAKAEVETTDPEVLAAEERFRAASERYAASGLEDALAARGVS